MDPHNQTPSFEIPKNAENDPARIHSGDFDPSLKREGSHEILPAPQQNGSYQPQQQSVVPGTNHAASHPAVVQQTVASSSSHLIADDADVIEKEWVERAKKIVAMTKHDPHLESNELAKLKATYMKQRFNKDSITSGSSS